MSRRAIANIESVKESIRERITKSQRRRITTIPITVHSLVILMDEHDRMGEENEILKKQLLISGGENHDSLTITQGANPH